MSSKQQRNCVLTVAETRVREGAFLLDAKVPGWEKKIDIGILDIDSSACCAIGQVFEETFEKGCRKLGLSEKPEITTQFGFCVDIFADTDSLNKAWRECIAERISK